MAFSGVCVVLLLSTCVLLPPAQSCDVTVMKNEAVSEKTFNRMLHNVYSTTVMTRINCSKHCNDDEQCNGMIVCPGVCHLFGVFYLLNNVSHLEGDHQSCSVFNMNRCKNNGLLDENGYCVCARGYGGPFCENHVNETCYENWAMIHDTRNNETFDDFKTAMRTTCPLKLKVLIEGTKLHNVDVHDNWGTNVWSQSLYSLRKSSWKTFGDIPTRTFLMLANGDILTTADVYIKGDTESISMLRVRVKWFAKDFSDGTPKVKTNKTGAAVEGDFVDTLSRIEDGSDVTSSRTVFVKEDKLEISREVFRLGMSFTGDNGTIESPLNWFLRRFTSAGFYYVLQWSISNANLMFNNTYKRNCYWCTDDCWAKILTTDRDGNVTFGSKSGLARSVKSGHKVRIYTKGIASSAVAVYIASGNISVVLENTMEPANEDQFNSSGIAGKRIVHSTGEIVTRRFLFERTVVIEDTLERDKIDWFVDTREWEKILTVTPMGNVNNDSLAKLYELILNGASVRIVIEFSNGTVETFEADNLETSNNSHVAAEITYQAATVITNNDVSFNQKDETQAWSAIITTEGEFRKYHYSYHMTGGYHENITDVETYSWYVQI